MFNGDFSFFGGPGTYPASDLVNGAPAVVFNGTQAGAAQYLATNASLPFFLGLYGNSDWTFEAWLLHAGKYNVNAGEQVARRVG